MRAARVTMLAVAALCTLAVATTIALRLTYPYDLEWLEGSTLCHALRLMHGQPIYGAPSVDFVPHPYTPLYPLTLAILGRLFGLGYTLARVVSLASFAGALALGWRLLRGEGVSRATAAAVLALPVAAYGPLGSWWDLARVDSLWLLLTAAAMTTLWRGRRSRGGVIAAALLLVAAFFAKQTAAPFMLVATVALARLAPRRVPLFVAALALAGLPLLAWLQHASDGWFWFYVSKLHRTHTFSPSLVARGVASMGGLLAPAWALVGWALVRTRTDAEAGALRYLGFVAAAAVAIAALAHGTRGAHVNAYLPAVYFSSLALGLAASRLEALGRATAASLVVTASLIAATGVVPWLGSLRTPERRSVQYDLRRLVPTVAERRAGDALVARLRATPGDVWVASHPFYAHLAGKRTFTSEMGLTDLGPVGLRIRGLAEAPFSAMVLDEPIADSPELVAQCRRLPRSQRLAGPGTVAGEKSVAQWRSP